MVSESEFKQNILHFFCLPTSNFNNVESERSLPQEKAGLAETYPNMQCFCIVLILYILFCFQSLILPLLCQKVTCLYSSVGLNFGTLLIYCMFLFHVTVPVAWRCNLTWTQMPMVRPRFRKQWKKQFDRSLKQEKLR